MSTARTGKVILAKNIKLDREHNFITDYTTTQMLTALRSQAHLVSEQTDLSFIRETREMDIKLPYGTVLQANYLAFQNPDYSNKWFFAFIDNVEFASPNTTRITFSIDELATWFDDWTPKSCFVVREHTNNDVAGNNLIPESFELGEYVSNGAITELTHSAVNVPPIIGLITSYIPEYPSRTYQSQDICGLPVAGVLVCFEYHEQLTNFLNKLAADGKSESVSMVFTINRGTTGYLSDTDYWYMFNSATPELDENIYYVFKGKNSPFTHYDTIARPATLNGYTPVNKKLLTYPYQALTITNNSGTSNVLCYEYFADPTACRINFDGVPSIGGSILNYPENYKGVEYNFREGVTGTKLPTLSWSKDAYTNWLTENAINRASTNVGMIGNVGGAIGGAVTAGLATASLGLGMVGAIPAAISGGMSIAQSAMNIASEKTKHALVPTSVNGNVNNADVLACGKNYGTYAIPVSIQYQFAERIDKFFTRYGYATNMIKVPNQVGRANWNYVEIAAGESIGVSTGTISVPADAMAVINAAYRKGVTIFHNIDNICDFSLSNGIITP